MLAIVGNDASSTLLAGTSGFPDGTTWMDPTYVFTWHSLLDTSSTEADGPQELGHRRRDVHRNSAGPGVELQCNFHKEYFRDRLARHVDERAASSSRGSGRELSSMFEELGTSTPLCLISFQRPGQATCVGAAKRRLTVLCGSSVGVRLWPGGARVGVRSAEI